MKEIIQLKSYPVKDVLDILLKNLATGENIIWATDSYAQYGKEYFAKRQITTKALIGLNPILIQPRISKAIKEQSERTKAHAEVFTPAWICNIMNNFHDKVWFQKKDIFNSENEFSWKTNKEKIKFQKNNSWKDYVTLKKIEITCGEAPFIVSRYDVSTGKLIEIKDRIGFLDRKLRVINENTKNEKEWMKWVIKAFQSSYGYEYQGDNLLIARINLLMTFCEYLKNKWHRKATQSELKKIADIISKNLWQMDGLKGVIPLGISVPEVQQTSFFDLIEESVMDKEKEIKCKIYDYIAKKTINFNEIVKEREKMKFDFAIGNPPYQEEVLNNGRQNPIYHKFMDETYKIADVTEFITPARFLFDAGQTPKEWNRKMLNDSHFKVLKYESDASTIFPKTDIKGG